MNNFVPNPETDTPIFLKNNKTKVYKGGEVIKFVSQFKTENHIIEAGVIARVSGCQYSDFVDVRTNRGAKIRRIPLTAIEQSDRPPNKTNKYYQPKFRVPEEDNFWLNATEEAKQGKILNLVNKALSGDLYFTHYSDYRNWIKQALLATR